MTKKINRMIEDNRPLSAIQSEVKAELLRQDKATWMSEKQSEYNLLFPIYEDELVNITIDELELNPIKYLMTGSNSGDFTDETKTYECKVIIDYSTDENYLTFTDWLNETIVITEAVEATYDEDGMILTEAVAEATKLVRPYTPLDVTDTMVQNRLNTYPEYSEFLKKQKEEDKQQIVVEHNTVKYQGDPMSINFMSAVGAVGAMRMFQVLVQSGAITQEQYDLVYKTVETWKGADDVLHKVQIESVVDACELAMKAMAKIIGVK